MVSKVFRVMFRQKKKKNKNFVHYFCVENKKILLKIKKENRIN